MSHNHGDLQCKHCKEVMKFGEQHKCRPSRLDQRAQQNARRALAKQSKRGLVTIEE